MKNADRIAKTKQQIRQTYLEIVETDGMGKVSVSQICEQANISRQTFYCYYENVEALFNDYISEVLSYINPNTIRLVMIEKDEAFIEDYCNMFRKNAKTLQVFLNGKSPEFEYYFKNRLFQNVPKPKNHNNDPIQKVSYNLVNAIQYELIKLLVFYPEIDQTVFLDLYLKLAESEIVKIYFSGFEK